MPLRWQSSRQSEKWSRQSRREAISSKFFLAVIFFPGSLQVDFAHVPPLPSPIPHPPLLRPASFYCILLQWRERRDKSVSTRVPVSLGSRQDMRCDFSFFFFCTMWNESKVHWVLGRDPEIPSCSQAPLLSALSALCPPFQYRVAWNLVSGDCAIPCCESHYGLNECKILAVGIGGGGEGMLAPIHAAFFASPQCASWRGFGGGKQSSVSRWARGREEGRLLCKACVHLGGGRRSK